jgi:aminoglycoside phosphotransferase (APT) family kinase protein
VTAPTWTPEREISLSLARRLIRDLPELADASVEPFAQGWDNSTFLVRRSDGEDLVFRFPRRAMALPGIRRELAWLPMLAPLLPFAIPVPQLRGSWTPDRPGDAAGEGADPWPFWGAAMLPGDELALTAPAAEERLRAAGQLGAFLRALHSLEPAALNAGPEAGLLVDPMHRGNPAERAPDTQACLGRLGQAGLEGPLDAAAALLDRAAQLPAPAAPGVICHGDLHVRHVLLSSAADVSWRVSGVIDWGDLCQGDPAVDLSIAFAAFSGAARSEFFAAYGAIDADRELRARALAVRLSALLTEYALAHVGAAGSLSDLLPEVSDGIRRALEA